MQADNLKIPLRDGRSFDMIFVKGGEFWMGDDNGEFEREKPAHRVKVGSFHIGQYPVTQWLYQHITGENPSRFKGKNRPVERVSWDDAQIFIKKLEEETGRKFRLPTEAEWEFAARGGTKSEGHKYAGSNKLKEVGWYEENSYGETKPVGLKFPNELCIYDMSGNVWEWCGDWYGKDYYKKCHEAGLAVDPKGPDGGVGRVYRGGGCFFSAVFCRSAYRAFSRPGNQFDSLGFRLVVPSQSVG